MSKSIKPDRNLAMEMVRITEAAAISAARYMGTGQKEAGDQAAVDAMRAVLDTVEVRGTVVIGEGEKDEAPMLYNGEKVGMGMGPVFRFPLMLSPKIIVVLNLKYLKRLLMLRGIRSSQYICL